MVDNADENVGTKEPGNNFIAPAPTTCMYCNGDVNPDGDETYHEVTTFVRGSRRDSSILRSYTGRFACRWCVKSISTRREAERNLVLRDATDDRARRIAEFHETKEYKELHESANALRAQRSHSRSENL